MQLVIIEVRPSSHGSAPRFSFPECEFGGIFHRYIIMGPSASDHVAGRIGGEEERPISDILRLPGPAEQHPRLWPPGSHLFIRAIKRNLPRNAKRFRF
jgi:hypothetical protein